MASPNYVPTTEVLARASNTMLNKKDKNTYPCLVPDLSGKVLSSSMFSMRLAVSLSHMAFNMFMYVLLIPSFKSFYHERIINLVKSFFCIYTQCVESFLIPPFHSLGLEVPSQSTFFFPLFRVSFLLYV